MRQPKPALLAALGLAALFASPRAFAASVPATGGVRLFENLEASPFAVVGQIVEPAQLDAHGWWAELGVEQALRGTVEPDLVVHVVWEELSTSRPVRFENGDRVVLCLAPLSGDSIWRQRIPDPEVRHRTLAIAERGDAFLRHPSGAEITTLQHYLALEPDIRGGPTGVGHLAQLAQWAQPQLALAAVQRLEAVANLDAQIEAPAANALVTALLRSDASPVFTEEVLALIERRRLVSLRDPLAALADADEIPDAVVFTALALLDEGLSPERTTRLLEHPDASYRLAGARHARGEGAEKALAYLMRSDPSTDVRAAAVTRYVELGGKGAVGPATSVLYDPDLSVRAAAARAVASQGAAAVPYLVDVVERGDPNAAQAAVAGLRFTNTREARDALQTIIDEHPDSGVRMLAELALGRPVGHKHE